jgi:hypothetical protein
MCGVEFNGETYHDDRIFVLHVCKCTVVAKDDDMLETTIYHEDAPDKHKWCLVTYRNVTRYPAIRVDHFDSFEAARDYMKKVEPTVPLISLCGRSPGTTLPYDKFIKWKAKNYFKEYDYKKMYLEGGSNPKEVMYSKRQGD